MVDKETKKNAYLYCKFRDMQFASYDTYVKSKGMLMNPFLVLNALYYAKDGYSQSEICQIVRLSKQIVSVIIIKLFNDNYVEYVLDDSDKRRKKIILTDSGREYCREAVTHITNAEDEAMARLSSEEQETLIKLSRKFSKILIELIEEK